jgi:hypothetical protein
MPEITFLVTAQVIHHHDVARTQGRHQELNHPGQKTLAIDWSVEHAPGDDGVTAQTRGEGQRLALTVRRPYSRVMFVFAQVSSPNGDPEARPDV